MRDIGNTSIITHRILQCTSQVHRKSNLRCRHRQKKIWILWQLLLFLSSLFETNGMFETNLPYDLDYLSNKGLWLITNSLILLNIVMDIWSKLFIKIFKLKLLVLSTSINWDITSFSTQRLDLFVKIQHFFFLLKGLMFLLRPNIPRIKF